jgi:hypothetical protein
MLRAHVPKAAVYEYRYFPASEDDIGPYAAIHQLESEVFSESITQCMQRSPQPHLGLGISPAIRLHVA